jgi:nicotinamidase-related amidase
VGGDPVVHKRACDAFYETDLAATLGRHGVTTLAVTGCATDFCVDTTIRAAASRDYEVLVVEDGHTTADRPHVDAVSLIRHHNWLWQSLIHPRRPITVLPAAELIARVQADAVGSGQPGR